MIQTTIRIDVQKVYACKNRNDIVILLPRIKIPNVVVIISVVDFTIVDHRNWNLFYFSIFVCSPFLVNIVAFKTIDMKSTRK